MRLDKIYKGFTCIYVDLRHALHLPLKLNLTPHTLNLTPSTSHRQPQLRLVLTGGEERVLNEIWLS